MIAYGCELEFWDEILLRREECNVRILFKNDSGDKRKKGFNK